MDYVIATILIAINTICLGLVVLRLPGIWLMVLCTALVAWARWDDGMFSIWTLAAVLALAAISEALECAAGVVGTRKAGGSRRGAAVSIVGGITGAIIGTILIPVPVVGSVIGAIVGAALGAWGTELLIGREMHEAVKSGAGAGAGTLAGVLIQMGFGILVWVIIAVAAFWP